MKKIRLGNTQNMVPAIAIGCMRLNSLEEKAAEEFILNCVEQEATFFDHADIYGGGESESLFGKALMNNPGIREKMFIQSKCGIVPGVMFDFSTEHIMNSVEGSLKRLHTDYLDMLLLHRPDALVEPEEVAKAFDQLKTSGKVRYFGVSNQNPMQIQLLQKYVSEPLLVNQLQFSIPVSNMVASGLEVNMTSDGAVNRDGSILDFCRLHDITIQAWSPFQKPNWQGLFLDSEDYAELNNVLAQIGEKYHASKTMIATAWILRHPAHMQMVAGTTNVERMKEIVQATSIELTREEWYKIYLSAGHGHILP